MARSKKKETELEWFIILTRMMNLNFEMPEFAKEEGWSREEYKFRKAMIGWVIGAMLRVNAPKIFKEYKKTAEEKAAKEKKKIQGKWVFIS